MIKEGDRIAVGVSGGKDSMALLAAMANLRIFYPEKFELVAITLDPRFGGEDADYSEIEELCKKLDVEYIIKRTQLAEVIFDIRKESNPCSLCARMRRGALHDAAKAAGCNKIALGHHLDDVAETFIMNLFNGGTLDCFMPVTYLSRKDIYMIRPMIFARESDCARVARKENLPVVKSKCPADGTTERQEVKEFLSSLEKKYGNVREKILGAMQRKEINGY
jgi:tRNA(Ile)-lysidine synthetase-like protein